MRTVSEVYYYIHERGSGVKLGIAANHSSDL